MSDLHVEAIRAEVDYRHERARASWPSASTRSSRGPALRLLTKIQRWMRSRGSHERAAEQRIRKTQHDDKDTYPMTIITRLTNEDEVYIRGIVADIEEGFNSNDPELLARHVGDDAVIVNPLGTVLRGPRAVEDSARELFIDGPLATATAHYRLTEISLLAPDVAVGHKRAWNTPEEADAGSSPVMIALYVFVRRDDRWRISRRQHTAVG